MEEPLTNLRGCENPTRVWCWWLVVDPFDDFEAILSCDYCGAGNTGDEVLQRNSALQCLVAHLQGAELSCIAVKKAKKEKKNDITDFITSENVLWLICYK